MDDMVAKALKRPKNFLRLSSREQWDIDKKLGLLDWDGPETDEDFEILKKYFNLK